MADIPGIDSVDALWRDRGTVSRKCSLNSTPICLCFDQDIYVTCIFLFCFRVDFFIPGVQTVGGFSICSSPKDLKDKKTIELAVKFNKHPPALWVHTKVVVYYFVCVCLYRLGGGGRYRLEGGERYRLGGGERYRLGEGGVVQVRGGGVQVRGR